MSAPEVTRIAVSLLRRDGGTQIRAQISMDVAKDYAEAMGRGDRFPPVRARYDGTHYWLSDGFHRVMAAELIQQVAIDTEVTPGTRRDALFDAIGANASHGYRRTNADKRQAVLTLLNDAEWSKKSDRELARIAHVDPGMVGRLRPQPSVDEPQTRTVSRGGATFEMNVTPINRDRRSAEVPTPASRGSKQLRIFLGELRQGADVETAAVVAEMSPGEARLHLEAEQAGEYADIVAIAPSWSAQGDLMALGVAHADDFVADLPPSAANDEDPEPQPTLGAPPFDFEAAQRRDAVMGAIAVIASAPPADELASMWAKYVGRGAPADIVSRAVVWLAAFADLFPDAEARRQQAIAAMMEEL